MSVGNLFCILSRERVCWVTDFSRSRSVTRSTIFNLFCLIDFFDSWAETRKKYPFYSSSIIQRKERFYCKNAFQIWSSLKIISAGFFQAFWWIMKRGHHGHRRKKRWWIVSRDIGHICMLLNRGPALYPPKISIYRNGNLYSPLCPLSDKEVL